MCRKYGGLRRWNNMVGSLIRKKARSVDEATPVSELSEDTELDKEAFSLILGKIDQGLRALPATAQVSTMPAPLCMGDMRCVLQQAFLYLPA